MPSIDLTIDHRLRVYVNDIPDGLEEPLAEALTLLNLEREEARKQKLWGWEQIPSHRVMYELEDEDGDHPVLTMPRGFLPDLLAGFESSGVTVNVNDERAARNVFRVGKKIELREHQPAAVDAILESEQGIWKAPPGSGKTVGVLAAGKRSGHSCLIIVNTKDIARQWVDRIHEHLDPSIEVGVIGDDSMTYGHNWTVAIVNTLESRHEELERDGFFDRFGFVCLDECHHATARTYYKAMNRFSARIRIGVSATPAKTGDFALAKIVLGPVIHVTTHKQLQNKGYLIKPTIVKLTSDFEFAFRGTTSRYSRTNYPDMLNALMEDPERNRLIIRAIMKESGHHVLVLSKRHDHIDLLAAMLKDAGWEWEIAKLTGKEKNAERERVIEMMGAVPSCTFSTIADEALDVPRIDRLILAWPQKNTGLIEQQIGRAEREHPDKEDAIVIDIADVGCGATKAQWTTRYSNLYKRRKFKIVRRTAADYQ